MPIDPKFRHIMFAKYRTGDPSSLPFFTAKLMMPKLSSISQISKASLKSYSEIINHHECIAMAFVGNEPVSLARSDGNCGWAKSDRQ